MKEFSRVDKKAKAKWRLNRFLWLFVLAIVSGIVMLGVSSVGEPALNILAGIVCGIILLLQLVNLIVYPIIEYIQWEYLIDDDRIEIKKGIFWRSHTVIPISRIQHVASRSGPAQNLFGLATVEIHTAGAAHSIDDLNKEVAKDICEKLKNIVNLKVAEQRARELIAEHHAAAADEQVVAEVVAEMEAAIEAEFENAEVGTDA